MHDFDPKLKVMIVFIRVGTKWCSQWTDAGVYFCKSNLKYKIYEKSILWIIFWPEIYFLFNANIFALFTLMIRSLEDLAFRFKEFVKAFFKN